MEITVRTIRPCDYSHNPDFPMMEAVVVFYDEKAEYHQSAEVLLFIEKKDYPLSQLKEVAIQKARDFLKLALSSHPD